MMVAAGLSAKVTAAVTEEMTARSQGSGDVDGLATPVLARLMEMAAVKAVNGHLGPDMTSVGTGLDITHAAPTPVGMEVTARATLIQVEGRLLIFSVTAADVSGVVGKGTHERTIVRREGFAERLRSRWQAPTEIGCSESI